MENYQGRFEDLEWYDKENNQTVIIGGAGGIGSWLTLFLARIGHEIYVFDHDNIDSTNMGGQLYPVSDIGENKAISISETSKRFCGKQLLINPMAEKYTVDSFKHSIMFSAFDSMEARKTMFHAWKQSNNPQIFVDGRMRAEYFEVFAVTPGREHKYEEELFDDDEVEDLPCSAKATTHCGAMCAGTMVSVFNNFLANQKHENIRELPFKTMVDLSLFMFDVELETIEESIT